MIKVGIGQDSHRFSKDENKPLFLGGVKFLNEIGLEGNSDGDVVIHALCNALGSAIGEGSLSTYSDKMCKNSVTDSTEYLKVVLMNVKNRGYKVNNVSISVEAQKPKIESSGDKMKTKLAKLIGIKKDSVGITATTGEGLTAFGRGEGIQVFAIVSLIKR